MTIIMTFGVLSLTRFGDTSVAAFCVIWGILCLAYYQLAFLFSALPAHLLLFSLGKPGIVLKLWSLIGGGLSACAALAALRVSSEKPRTGDAGMLVLFAFVVGFSSFLFSGWVFRKQGARQGPEWHPRSPSD